MSGPLRQRQGGALSKEARPVELRIRGDVQERCLGRVAMCKEDGSIHRFGTHSTTPARALRTREMTLESEV